MAQNQNNNSKLGVFKKMYNATIGRIFNRPHHPRASVRTTKSPPVPAHIVHHPSQTKTIIPIEFEHHKNKNNNVTVFSPNLHSNDSSREVALPRAGQVDYGDQGKKLEHTKTNEMISDYIVKVKDKMRSKSNVGTLRSVTKRDSFNDKVSNYINQVKFRNRTTTSLGDDKGVSFK